VARRKRWRIGRAFASEPGRGYVSYRYLAADGLGDRVGSKGSLHRQRNTTSQPVADNQEGIPVDLSDGESLDDDHL
jgi:hypothetical protein